MLAVWTLTTGLCPVPEHAPEAMTTQSHAADHHTQGAHSPQHDADVCCQVLGHAYAVAPSLAGKSAAKAVAAPILIAAAQVDLSSPPSRAGMQLIPVSTGPPRVLYQRFTTFWSHAPPAEHA